jgi:hypothetical protein
VAIYFFKTAGFNHSPTPPFLILTYSVSSRPICYTLNPRCCILVLRSVAKAGAKPANIRRVKLLMISTVKAIIVLHGVGMGLASTAPVQQR